MEFWDWMRWGNVALSATAAALMLAGCIARWEQFSPRLRRIAPWVVVTYALLAYGSGEVAASASDIDPGLRVALLSFNLVGLLGALLFRIAEPDD